MATFSITIVVALTVLVTFANAIQKTIYPGSWSSEDYLAYLMKEKEQEMLRPVVDRIFNTDDQGIGMISGIDVNSSGIVHIFHRANRVWDANTFSDNEVLSDELKEPIGQPTILALDPVTGNKIGGFGEGLFNMPHGLKFDYHDNIWVTDVGRHQVFRFPRESSKPDLTLGEAFVPGSDNGHFCKPTDVVAASNGDFFVADGYCNSRIMKFDKTGKYVTKIGMLQSQRPSSDPDPYAFNTPHSLLLVEELDIVCVADRDNGRAMCYNAGVNSRRPVGALNRTLIPEGEIGRVFSIYYNKEDFNVIAAAKVDNVPFPLDTNMYYPEPRAYTFGFDGKEMVEWAYVTPDIADRGPSLIHALCSSPDGKDYFLADVRQRKVYKYSKPQMRSSN